MILKWSVEFFKCSSISTVAGYESTYVPVSCWALFKIYYAAICNRVIKWIPRDYCN